MCVSMWATVIGNGSRLTRAKWTKKHYYFSQRLVVWSISNRFIESVNAGAMSVMYASTYALQFNRNFLLEYFPQWEKCSQPKRARRQIHYGYTAFSGRFYCWRLQLEVRLVMLWKLFAELLCRVISHSQAAIIVASDEIVTRIKITNFGILTVTKAITDGFCHRKNGYAESNKEFRRFRVW